MNDRDRLLLVMLWLAIIGMGSQAGGILDPMVEVVPVWSASPPGPVRTFFGDTDFGRHKVRFFGPASMVSRWVFADRVRFVVGLVGLFAPPSSKSL